ncbi:MAG: hypothetical protein WCJ59_01515 [bacterium]
MSNGIKVALGIGRNRQNCKGFEKNFAGMSRIVRPMVIRQPRPQPKAAIVDSHGNYTYCY